MKIALFAAYKAGRLVSDQVLASGRLPSLVVTCPTDPHASALAQSWEAAGVPVLPCASVNSAETIDILRKLAPDLCVLAWWPEIVKSPVLEIPARGWVNMHPSLLPWGKGKHGYYWSIVHDEPFGVSLHLIDAGIDSGAVLFQREVPVSWTDTGESLYHRSFTTIVDLFGDSWPLIAEGRLDPRPQDPRDGSYHWGREIEEHSRIDLDRTYTGRELLNILRGRTFWEGDSAWFSDQGKKFRAKLRIEEVT